MGLIKEFRDFALRGNVLDLAVGVIIGAAFGGLTKSMVDDILMPPIGRMLGNLDFSNLYVSLSDKVDAANTVAEPVRMSLAKARELGPVIAYGNFITLVINFVIVAFCVFLLIKAINVAAKKFEREKAAEAAAPAVPPADVQLLTEIRDILKTNPR